MLKGRVLTKDNLLKREWNGDVRSTLCLVELETVAHFFLGCQFTKGILLGLILNKSALVSANSPLRLWDTCRRSYSTLRGKELLAIALAWLGIWLERNKRTFDNRKLSAGCLAAAIRFYRDLWVKVAC